MKIMHVVGARPNFPKVAPIISAMAKRRDVFQQMLVHTGQHYDYDMSQVFFEHLDLPEPDEYLDVGSGSHAQQTAQIMARFEPVLQAHQPDWVVVVGDVNSTVACALVCAKLQVPVAHVEAGLRSGDRSMPEEINRVLTDQIAELLFVPSPDGVRNLRHEGIDDSRIHLVGNVMIDTLVNMLPRAESRGICTELGLAARQYVLATIHRPSNVDHAHTLAEVLRGLEMIAKTAPVVFPVHPRTRHKIEQSGLAANHSRLRLIDPLGYLDFLAVMKDARLVVTDSGGIQEETTYLGIPCLTARPNTERPITVEMGTNELVDSRCEALVSAFDRRWVEPNNGHVCPPLWDGRAAARIAASLAGEPTSLWEAGPSARLPRLT